MDPLRVEPTPAFKPLEDMCSRVATELTPGVWQFELRGVNAYLVEDDVPTLVDAGSPWDKARLRDGLAETGVGIGEIERVVLTHYDLDHVGTLAGLTPALDATVYAGVFDAEILTDRRSPPVRNHKGAFQRLSRIFTAHPSLPVERIEDGETIGSFTAYHTPGHTPGHTAYVSPDLRVGLLGDLVTESGGELHTSPWLMSYDTAAVHESVLRLSEQTPPFEVACIGHGTPLTTGGSEALSALAREL